MTKKDALGLLGMLQSNYQAVYGKQTPQQAGAQAETWMIAFGDYDVNVTTKALVAAMLRKPDFPPSLNEIMTELNKMLRPEIDVVPGEEAWERVWKLVRRYPLSQPFGSWSRENQENFGSLLDTDPVLSQPYTKKAVSAVGSWMAIGCCPLEGLSYLRNSFVKTYNELVNRDTSLAMIPPTLSAEIAAIRDNHLPKLPRAAGDIVYIADARKAAGTDYIPGDKNTGLEAIGGILKELRSGNED